MESGLTVTPMLLVLSSSLCVRLVTVDVFLMLVMVDIPVSIYTQIPIQTNSVHVEEKVCLFQFSLSHALSLLI